EQKGPGAVSDVRGVPDAHVMSKEEEAEAKRAMNAFEKLRTELRGIAEASNPVTDAQEKLAHAQEIVTKAVQAANPVTHEHLLSLTEGVKILRDYETKLRDQLEPFEAWVRKLGEASAALRDTAEEQERAARLTSFEQETKKQGIVLTEQQIAEA